MSSQKTQGLLPQPGLEDSFHKMLPVRCGRCGLENLHLMKDWESEGGSVKGKRDLMIDITKLGWLPILKSLLPKEIRDGKHLEKIPTLSHLRF